MKSEVIERRELLKLGSAVAVGLAAGPALAMPAASSIPELTLADLAGCDLLGTADPFWTAEAAKLIGIRPPI